MINSQKYLLFLQGFHRQSISQSGETINLILIQHGHTDFLVLALNP